MSVLDNLRMAWEALSTQKLRSCLAIIGVAIAVAAIVGLSSVSTGSRQAVIKQLTDYGTKLFQVQFGLPTRGDPTQRLLITPADVEELQRSLDHMVKAVPLLSYQSIYRTRQQRGVWYVSGTVPDELEVVGLHVTEGRWLASEDAGQYVIVMGESLAQDTFGSSQVVGEVIYLDDHPYTVVGVVSNASGIAGAVSPPSRQVFVPLLTAQRLTGERNYSLVTFEAADAAEVPKLRAVAVDLLARRHPGFVFQTFIVEHNADDAKQVFDILTKVIVAVTSIALLVGGIGVTNIMLISVTERTREIGIRKAMGATRLQILGQFLIEAILICLVGGLAGLALSSVLVYTADRLWLHFGLRLPVYAVGLAVLTSCATGLVTGVYPATRAARLDPVEALRHE